MNDLKKGDKVIVKKGTFFDNIVSIDLSGYTGTIEKTIITLLVTCFVTIKWDEKTINSMPLDFIEKCKFNDLDYERIILDTRKIYKFKGE